MSDQKRVLFVIGTRPELIKLAPVIREARSRPGVLPLVCFTGQHTDLVRELAPFFDIYADIDLDVMRPGQDLTSLTARLLSGLGAAMDEVEPAVVVAQGDTTSVLAAGLAALYRQIPFAHVEAGLRTADLLSPFPEEANRRIAGQLAALHFAPTRRAADNLLSSGVPADAISVCGNTVVDAVRYARARVGALDDETRRVLVTIHRRENHGAVLEGIVAAVRGLAEAHPDVEFLWPVHPNPNVRAVVERGAAGLENLSLCSPLPYDELVAVLSSSELVLTDSGGLQEEAPSLDVPVVVVRESTERQEGVEAGCAILVGVNSASIFACTSSLLNDEAARLRMASAHNPFGDGLSSTRVMNRIERFLFADSRNETEPAELRAA
jgi:UDP-N-acetylglucosamine 2-epimerase (non-hydrolysing)